MRILFYTDTFLPEVNGVTTVLRVMRDGLRLRGHEVAMVAPGYRSVTDDESGITRLGAFPCPGYPQVRLSFPWGLGLAGDSDRFAPDVVHLVTEGPLGFFGRGYARSRRLPIVSSFHTDFPRYAARYLGRFAARPTRPWLRWFHRAAAITQTPGERIREELLQLGLTKVTVWGRGVDSTWFRPERRSESRRAELGAAGRVLVLHVGRLAVEKDVATLIAAFRRAHVVLGGGAVFCVAGEGPKAAEVRAALPFARHQGFLDRGRLADLYADADLFVFPSPTETCGLVALEALASGVPVVGARAGGIPENLREGITGTLAIPGDAEDFAEAIVTLAGEAELRRAMSVSARAFAVARDWARELDQLEATYARLQWTPRAVSAPSNWPTTTSVG